MREALSFWVFSIFSNPKKVCEHVKSNLLTSEEKPLFVVDKLRLEQLVDDLKATKRFHRQCLLLSIKPQDVSHLETEFIEKYQKLISLNKTSNKDKEETRAIVDDIHTTIVKMDRILLSSWNIQRQKQAS